jgi:hypothetical protein
MGKSNILQKIRSLIAKIGWKLFIWAEYNGNEKEYFDRCEKICKDGYIGPRN